MFKVYVEGNVGFKRIKKIIRHFSKSNASKSELKKLADLAIIKLNPTRWAEWIKALNRFFHLRQDIHQVSSIMLKPAEFGQFSL